jgi:hypothetical protein
VCVCLSTDAAALVVCLASSVLLSAQCLVAPLLSIHLYLCMHVYICMYVAVLYLQHFECDALLVSEGRPVLDLLCEVQC